MGASGKVFLLRIKCFYLFSTHFLPLSASYTVVSCTVYFTYPPPIGRLAHPAQAISWHPCILALSAIFSVRMWYLMIYDLHLFPSISLVLSEFVSQGRVDERSRAHFHRHPVLFGRPRYFCCVLGVWPYRVRKNHQQRPGKDTMALYINAT